jgi:pimeloyl-ACP methyl ester carboxylesterase
MEQRSIEEVVARWEEQPVFGTQPPETVAAQRPGRLSHDPRLLARLLRSAGQGACEPVWERIPELGLPLLAVAGERDERYVAAARRLAELAPRGALRLVPGAGHAPQLERPRELARLLLEFLDQHLGERGIVNGDAEPGPLGHPE